MYARERVAKKCAEARTGGPDHALRFVTDLRPRGYEPAARGERRHVRAAGLGEGRETLTKPQGAEKWVE